MLWKGTFLEVNDEQTVVEENKLKVDKKFCDEKSLKQNSKGSIVTL